MNPLSFETMAPTAGASEYLQDPFVRLIVDFFRAKGHEALKQEDRQEVWYQDWIDYQARHGLYAGLLSPQCLSSRGNRFDLLRLTRFAETLAYFSPAHAYSLHVTLLGLFPILMSANEGLKREAVAKLEAGGLFAFAVSEQTHGADLFANECTVTPAESGGYRANGTKYYIGNANAADLVSVLGKKVASRTGQARRSPFMFFALRPAQSPAYQNVRKIRTSGIKAAFVGSFEVKNHPVAEGDVIAEGREAWESIFGTVNFGKFILGFGAIGICEHALAEGVVYMRRRILYGKPVTDMPHIRLATAVAFARLAAMKLFAYRAVEYLLAARPDDRRYLLFNAVQKARVSTEGVKVMGLLFECVGARAVEAETYFESGWRDAQLVPSLEGSTHINFGLAAQFIDSYFDSTNADAPPPASVVSTQAGAGENLYWMDARDRNPKTVRFAPFLAAYRPLKSVRSVRSFARQVRDFRRFAIDGLTTLNPASEAGLFIALGKCLAIIAYGQLVAENCRTSNTPASLIDLIFHGLVEDLSAEALQLSAQFLPGSPNRRLLKRVVRVPTITTADVERVAELIAARYAA